MNRLSFFLARRIFFTSIYKKNIATISLICFIGIFIGSFALTIISAVTRGFEITIHHKIQGVHAHLTIDAYGKPINFKAIRHVLHNEFPDVAACSPHTERHALIRPYNNTDNMPTVIIIKSINPELEMNTSSLFNKIIQPRNAANLSELLTHNSLIIGKQYALSNNLSVGDDIELLFPRESKISGTTVTFDSQRAIVGGIFDTGTDEFDSNIIYCSFTFLKNIFTDAAVEQVNIALHKHADEKVMIKKLHERLKLSVYSWKDLYPSLVATLRLEKYVSFVIIALIILVASMNIISLIHMLITQKRHDIALLMSMGMSRTTVTAIFFITGLSISLTATALGLVGALITSYFITKYPCISLPDTYYNTHLPISMEPYIIISVLCVVLFFTLIALFFSTRQLKDINISRVLRFGE